MKKVNLNVKVTLKVTIICIGTYNSFTLLCDMLSNIELC